MQHRFRSIIKQNISTLGAFTLALLFLLTAISCEKDDETEHDCDGQVIVDSELYKTAPKDYVTINTMEIEGDCLNINFSSSGCSGDSWIVKLVDADVVMESNPPQRNLVFSLKNEELCEAVITKDISFDISTLQIEDGWIFLNVTNTDDRILYEFKK